MAERLRKAERIEDMQGEKVCFMDFTDAVEFWKKKKKKFDKTLSDEQIEKMSDELMDELLSIIDDNRWFFWNGFEETKWKILSGDYGVRLNGLFREIQSSKYVGEFANIISGDDKISIWKQFKK